MKVHDKLRALELLGHHHKLFATEVQPRDVPKTEQATAPQTAINDLRDNMARYDQPMPRLQPAAPATIGTARRR